MELITKELEEKFEKYPIGSQEGMGGNAKVIVKYFNPVGAGTWLITEADKLENGDYMMFGYCHLGDNEMAELGYVLLSQLKELELPLNFTIESDLYMRENINLIDAIKMQGFSVPNYLLKSEEEIDMEL